jgi:NAD(P)-dependent dehydrogenase (short-subunit alcohol dehydrogenase family)
MLEFLVPLLLTVIAAELWVVVMKLDTIIAIGKKPYAPSRATSASGIKIVGQAQAELVARTVPLQRQGTPADMAPMFVFLVSDESAYVTSQALLVDGGLMG